LKKEAVSKVNNNKGCDAGPAFAESASWRSRQALTRHPIFNTEKLDRGSEAAMTTRLLRQPFSFTDRLKS